MQLKRTAAVVGAVLTVALGLSACGGDAGSAGGSKTITVTVAGPMTGDFAVYGLDQLAGVEFAAKEINDAGGIPAGPLKGFKIRVTKSDDGGDPNQGATLAQKICDDSDIMAVFGHSNSAVTLAALPIYERCGVPLFVSYSSNSEITAKLHNNLFRTLLNDLQFGAEMATFSKDKLGFTQVGVIQSSDDYGQGVGAQFKETAAEESLTVAETVTTSENQKDFTPQLTELRNAGADSLVLLTGYTDAALQIKQAAAMGWDVPIFVPPGANSPELIKIAGADAAEGVVIAAVFDPSQPSSASFVEGFTAAMGKAPGEASAMSYDSAHVFFTSLEDGAKDRQSVIDTTHHIGTFDLPIHGELTFNDRHEPTVVPGQPSQVLLQVKDGKITSYTG